MANQSLKSCPGTFSRMPDDGDLGITGNISGGEDAGRVDSAEKCPDIGVGRILQDVLGGADLHHPAPFHDRDPVTDAHRLIKVVGDENDGPFALACSLSSSSCISVRISGSSAENASSISRMSGLTARPRARPTRCCMPPENSFGRLSSYGSRPT